MEADLADPKTDDAAGAEGDEGMSAKDRQIRIMENGPRIRILTRLA